MNRRREWMLNVSALSASAALSGWPLAAAASTEGDYPRPGSTLRYVVPFPPGGLTDVMARQVAQALGERWKVNVVVDNKPGGAAQIGADAVAKAAPEGYTLLAITLSHAANVTLFPKPAYNFQKDLRPVALLAGSPMLVVVPEASPVKTLAELVTMAKGKPLNAGSSGNGTPPHLTLALFNQLAQTSIQHVPYKGGAPSMTDLIGGQLDVVFSNLPESIAHVKGGKLRAIAVTGASRHPLVPQVPTAAEAGWPGLSVENWTGIMAPAGMPDAAVAKLSSEVVRIMAAPDVEERARGQGFRVDARPADKFQPFLNDEIARWAQVIKTAGIRAD